MNAELQILQFRGPTSAYLEPPTGKASFDVLKMAREGLLLPLRAAIGKARKENRSARKQNVLVKQNGATRAVNVEVIPLKNSRERCFLILFDDAEKAGRTGASTPSSRQPGGATRTPRRPSKKQETRRATDLGRELSETRDYLQSVLEEHESANEELQASSEEVQSANEELQSINEELETSKEELESTNEELTTVNEEMANRNVELNRLNSDLVNVQTSAHLAIVLLGRDLTIRRFSAQAEKQFNLLATDVGRPIGNIRHNLDLTDLEAFVGDVIAGVRGKEREVRDKKGRWYSLRVRPYLTFDNKVDGAVLVLVNIDGLKRTEQLVSDAREHAEAIVETLPDPLVILHGDLRVHSANEAFYKTFKVSRAETEGCSFFEVGNRQWNISRLRALLDDIVPRNSFFNDVEVTHDFERIGRRTMVLNARTLRQADGKSQLVLLGVRDISERKAAELMVDRQKQALELLAEGAPLDQVLEFLTSVVEGQSAEGMLASITPLNEAGTHFQRGIGASLPDAFNTAVEGVEISSPSGLCAHAVQRREPVAVHDFNEGTEWQMFAQFVAPFGLRAGWSAPIISSAGQMLGTFANYYRHPRDPTPQNRALVEVVLRTAAIAIERKRAEDALKRRTAEFQSLLNEAPLRIYVVDADFRIRQVNPTALPVFGDIPDLIGRDFDEVIHILWPKEYADEIVQRFRHTLETGEPYIVPERIEQRLDRGVTEYYEWQINRILLPDGRHGVVCYFRDISERILAHQRVRDSEERLRLSQEVARVGTFDWNIETGVNIWTPELEAIYGLPKGGFARTQPAWESLVHPDDRAAALNKVEQALQTGEAVEGEWRVVWPDGSIRWLAARFQAFMDQTGKPVRVAGVNIDITDRKQAEERQRFLTNELAHRGKNLLAVVQAIVSLSLSGTQPLAEAREVLARRVQALARSQSIPGAVGFGGVPVAETIRAEFEAFSDRVEAVGPDVMLNSKAAQTFALLVHELATNATKHGALARAGGQVDINWSIEGAGAEARFKFQWQERGGPTVTPPSHQGFGRILLEKAVAQDFDTQPKLRFAPEGLGYEIDAPLLAIVAGAGSA